MQYRRLVPVAALVLAACAGQRTRPPPDEPRTPSVTSAALTSDARVHTTTQAEPTREPTVAPSPMVAPRPVPPRFQAALAKNPALESYLLEQVSIEQEGGHVTLRGFTPTVADKVQVEMAVRSVPGVTSVTNDISTRR
jgi:hypothetical protein